MTNTKLFLLLGTSLSLVPQTMSAAECAVTDCSLLGYTDSACPGSGLKCPFGEGWYCGGGAAEDCIKLGYDKDCTGAGESGSGETCNGKYLSCTCDSSYKYTCTGTGYSGGSGTACGGKYTACTCKSPYTWTSGACKCPSNYTYTCTGTGYSGGTGSACGGKYTACTCKSPYTWTSGACKCPSNYTYTCSGTGYSGGVGTACGGKYTKCNCSSNYSWNGSSCALSCSSSYKYTCSGTGYSGGSGTACGGKYAACTCASGYEWKDGSCQKQVLNGAQGELYYCNGKVVGVRATGMGFYVAMKDLGYMTWSNANSQCRNYSFCGNVKGTLPTKDQLLTLYNNKSQVNSLLSTNGGTQLTNNWHWSSTAGGGLGNHYLVHMSSGNVNSYITNYGYVRPVLTSW